MASNHGSGRSSPISTSDFNARAKALSERLGEVGKPQERPRQNWNRSRPRSPQPGASGTPESEPGHEPSSGPGTAASAEASGEGEGGDATGGDRTV